MTKVFVAQTHENDRKLVAEFLKAAGHDVRPFSTDAMSLMWMTREMMFLTEQFAVVTSQRDEGGCDYISNMVHTAVLSMYPRTLTIVYSRAVSHQENVQGVVRYLADLSGTIGHQLKFVPKMEDDTRNKECETLLQYIHDFERGLKAA